MTAAVVEGRETRTPHVLSPRWTLVVAGSATTLALLGLGHLVALGLLWDLAQPGPRHDAGIHPEDGSAVGLVAAALVALAGLSFVLGAGLLAARLRAWRRVSAVGAAASLPVLLAAGPPAALGVVLDLGVLGVLVLGAALPVDRGSRSWARRAERRHPRPAG